MAHRFLFTLIVDTPMHENFSTLLDTFKDTNAAVSFQGVEEVEGRQGITLEIRYPNGFAYFALVFLADFPRPMGASNGSANAE